MVKDGADDHLGRAAAPWYVRRRTAYLERRMARATSETEREGYRRMIEQVNRDMDIEGPDW